MRFYLYIILFISLLSSCKSNFEQVRLSNNPGRILEESIKYYDKGEYLKAQTLMELILNQYRGTRDGEELFFKYAYTHYKLGNYALAATYFTNFSNTFTYSPYTEESDFMIAYASYQQSPSFRLDQTPSIDAINGFQDFANKYPDSERVEECNQLIDELRVKLELKAYQQGILYYNLKQYNAAVTAFTNMLTQFPESEHAEHARFLILKSSYDYAINSVYEKREMRLKDANLRYKEYISRNPSGKHAKQAREINTLIQTESKNLIK
jgi:outer membrane protein assembly factor BamD